jgi:hypothetical protein
MMCETRAELEEKERAGMAVLTDGEENKRKAFALSRETHEFRKRF